MKIKRISLFNIGPYINLNSFDLDLEKDKNIILIGGKNGAGKTTFFKSIKTCLYGCKVWGFDAPCKEYYSIINGIVNSKSMYANSSLAYIEIDLYFNDGKQINTYTLHREWKKNKQTFCEFFNVKKNGELIIGAEENDFINYLLSIIPPDMFNFYFFDGESIAEFFLGSEGNKNFRNAFLKLYGLDTLSIMIDNFNRNIKKSSVKDSSYAKFLEAKKRFTIEEQKCEELHNDIFNIESQIDSLQMKNQLLQDNYKKDGGISIAEWKQLNSQLIQEESDRDNINRWLKEIANHYLPFVILHNELDGLFFDLTKSQDIQRNKSLLEALNNSEFKISLDNYIRSKNATTITADDIAEFVNKSMEKQELGLDYDLTLNQINKVIAQIYEKKEIDIQSVKNAVLKLNKSLKNTKKIRDQLAASNIDNYETYIVERENIEKTVSTLSLKLDQKKKEYESQCEALSLANKEMLACKASYESVLKSKSISNISERGAAAFSLVEDALVARQASILQKEFIACFKAIINKQNFIDGIVIDKKINVIPYKYVSIKREQLENYKCINKDFLTLFSDAKIIIDMNKLEFCEVDSIKVPSPIAAPFSQGERQVYIMSLYLALLKTSHKDIPFFIDTPFARIDSNHRENIVKEFFTKVNNQMFILSTDEEIVGEYKDMLSHRLSNTFTLKISSYGSTKIMPDDYFGE